MTLRSRLVVNLFFNLIKLIEANSKLEKEFEEELRKFERTFEKMRS
jgi:hypothetical protein